MKVFVFVQPEGVCFQNSKVLDGLCRANEDCVEGETVVAGNGRKPNKLLGGIIVKFWIEMDLPLI